MVEKYIIDVLTIVKIKEASITLFGKIDESNHTIELNYPITGADTAELGKEIIYQRPIDMPLFDTNAQQYSVYGCKFTKSHLAISTSGVTTITGFFSRLVCEGEISKQYNSTLFSFVDIEKLLPFERFITEYDDIHGKLIFRRESHEVFQYTLSEDVFCTVESYFDGVIESERLYNLDVRQKKIIRLTFKRVQTIEYILTVVRKIKRYFEFLTKQEILLDEIYFANANDLHKKSKLIYDPILLPNTFIRPIKDVKYYEAQETIFAGLSGWLNGYDEYHKVFEIWAKTIYNTNVSEDDLFIWRCQAFELLCSINKHIFEKANALKSRGQANPNLKNFLSATSTIYKILENSDTQYFKDLKDVRDKLTHNNPLKTITNSQKKNSYNLIEFFLLKTMEAVFSIQGLSISLCLQGTTKSNNS